MARSGHPPRGCGVRILTCRPGPSRWIWTTPPAAVRSSGRCERQPPGRGWYRAMLRLSVLPACDSAPSCSTERGKCCLPFPTETGGRPLNRASWLNVTVGSSTNAPGIGRFRRVRPAGSCGCAPIGPRPCFKAAHVLGLAEWLVYLLTGVPAAEASLAAETLLLDVATGDWADDVVGSWACPLLLLPPVCRAGAVVGPLLPSIAAELGLTAGTPVILAGADTQCALLAVGCSEPGMVGIVAGSTLPVQLVTSRPWVDTGARVWTAPHVRAGRWVLEANAGRPAMWWSGSQTLCIPKPRGPLRICWLKPVWLHRGRAASSRRSEPPS